MAYNDHEGSAAGGEPIDLYRITLGSEVFRFTSAAEDVVAAGETWLAYPGVEADVFELGEEAQDQSREVAVYGDHPFIQRFSPGSPSETPVLEVLQVHYSDLSDERRVWEGEVVEVVWREESAVAAIIARPREAAFDTRTPRRDAGALCPYMLYDTQCTVARSSFQYDGTAGSVSGTSLTVSGLDSSKGVGWATAGECIFGDERRVVMAHTATDTLELDSPFLEDPTGSTVTVHAGCDRTIATCASKFSNDINFGGDHLIPTRDITQTGI